MSRTLRTSPSQAEGLCRTLPRLLLALLFREKLCGINKASFVPIVHFDLTAFVISMEPSGCLSIPAEVQSGKAVSHIPHKVSLFVVSSQAGSLC